VHQSDWFYEDVDHWNYQAAIKAIERTWDVTPRITCEGGRSVFIECRQKTSCQLATVSQSLWT
jgi:hypothetical protein